jgi:hypothetical protein
VYARKQSTWRGTDGDAIYRAAALSNDISSHRAGIARSGLRSQYHHRHPSCADVIALGSVGRLLVWEKKMVHLRSLFGIFAVCFSVSSFATDVTLSNVRLDSVAAIGVPAVGGFHKAGNIEIAVTGGFTAPAGFQCSDRYWITTLKTSDPDGNMLALLNAARTNNSTVTLTITDEPSLQAFPNRCSIRGASR